MFPNVTQAPSNHQTWHATLLRLAHSDATPKPVQPHSQEAKTLPEKQIRLYSSSSPMKKIKCIHHLCKNMRNFTSRIMKIQTARITMQLITSYKIEFFFFFNQEKDSQVKSIPSPSSESRCKEQLRITDIISPTTFHHCGLRGLVMWSWGFRPIVICWLTNFSMWVRLQKHVRGEGASSLTFKRTAW